MASGGSRPRSPVARWPVGGYPVAASQAAYACSTARFACSWRSVARSRREGLLHMAGSASSSSIVASAASARSTARSSSPTRRTAFFDGPVRAERPLPAAGLAAARRSCFAAETASAAASRRSSRTRAYSAQPPS